MLYPGHQFWHQEPRRTIWRFSCLDSNRILGVSWATNLIHHRNDLKISRRHSLEVFIYLFLFVGKHEFHLSACIQRWSMSVLKRTWSLFANHSLRSDMNQICKAKPQIMQMKLIFNCTALIKNMIRISRCSCRDKYVCDTRSYYDDLQHEHR